MHCPTVTQSPPVSPLTNKYPLSQDDKKSLEDPSEFKDESQQELSDSEGSDTPLCESPQPPLTPPPPPQVYAKSNAVKEQIQCKNGLNTSKKGNKAMTKYDWVSSLSV